MIDAIAQSLRGFRFSVTTESLLQSGIAEALTRLGHTFAREYKLTRGPVDFYLPDHRIAIEAKTAGNPSAVTKQVLDYLDEECVAGIILITRRRTLARIPDSALGKPIRCVWIGGASL